MQGFRLTVDFGQYKSSTKATLTSLPGSFNPYFAVTGAHSAVFFTDLLQPLSEAEESDKSEKPEDVCLTAEFWKGPGPKSYRSGFGRDIYIYIDMDHEIVFCQKSVDVFFFLDGLLKMTTSLPAIPTGLVSPKEIQEWKKLFSSNSDEQGKTSVQEERKTSEKLLQNDGDSTGLECLIISCVIWML